MITKNLNKNQINIPETMWHIVILKLSPGVATWDNCCREYMVYKSNEEDYMFFALSEDLPEKFESDALLGGKSLNDYCSSFALAYDSYVYNYNQCAKMIEWLDNRLLTPVDDDLKEFYVRLKEYAQKAVELQTGIAFDFR